LTAREAIGVDLGGRRIIKKVVGEGPDVLYRNLASSQGRTRAELLDLLERELRAAVAARPRAAAVGLGIPCTIDRRRGVCAGAVHLPLADVPLGELVAERIGLPATIDNDANVAAIAEHRYGAAAGAANVVLLTIGTGIGGGLMIAGRPYRGARGAGAELGHMVIDVNGPPCHGNCPNRGCVESLVSGTALARDGLEAAERHPDSELGRAFAEGEEIDGPRVVDAARAGDAPALEVVARAGRNLGAALSGFANCFDPDLIVLGGGVMAAGDLLLGPARSELRRLALAPQNEVPVEVAALGAEAGMVGAATLALDELVESDRALH
jgi:glucokinase